VLPKDQALPIFLAQNGVDVWGIDFRWTLVPATVTDLSFMQGWGIEQDARDLGVGIGLARVTRAMTGSGFGDFGVYTTTLLGSTDVTTHIVSLVPAEARIADFGHADLFLANNAKTLVWQPVLSWLQAH
jgi:hypothetical protein